MKWRITSMHTSTACNSYNHFRINMESIYSSVVLLFLLLKKAWWDLSVIIFWRTSERPYRDNLLLIADFPPITKDLGLIESVILKMTHLIRISPGYESFSKLTDSIVTLWNNLWLWSMITFLNRCQTKFSWILWNSS